MNVGNKATRELPITILLEYLHSLTQDWTYKSRNNANQPSLSLQKKSKDMLNKNFIQRLRLHVTFKT